MDPQLTSAIAELLRSGVEAGASDWHFDEGKKPAWRIEGRLMILNRAPELSTDDVQSLLRAATTDPGSTEGDSTFCHANERFRVSYGETREGASVVLRHIRATHPTLGELSVPARFIDLLEAREGLVLVSGPTGSGKSTTLNAAIDHLNREPEGGTITVLGDPIEFYHRERFCRIRHREFGKDFTSWPRMLARTLRQDPDIICISELRDPETMGMALAAAETGHLVLGTLHNGTAKDAIGRILETCPESDRDQQRAMLTKSLRAVLAQQLVPTTAGPRVAAFELLVNTEGVSNLIRERRFKQIDDEILRGQQHGMVAMDDSLLRLCENAEITRSTALHHARNAVTLAKYLQHL